MLGVLVFTNCSKDNDIKTVNEPEKLELPDDLSAIDLGLPSGTKRVRISIGSGNASISVTVPANP